MSRLFSFFAKDIKGRDVPLSSYRGNVMLIVNTASKCGFTSQYRGLQELYADYAPRSFTVLGFPCNQFLHQEPGTADQIATFCHENYSVTFPMFEKIDVNGPFAHPLYQWLVEQAPGILGSRAVKWNFTKFLIDRNGNPVVRYAPTMEPKNIRPAIERYLAENR